MSIIGGSLCVCVFVCVCVYVCTYVRMHLCMFVCTFCVNEHFDGLTAIKMSSTLDKQHA